MKIEKTLPRQIGLDLGPVITEPPKPKAYLDYSYKERVLLLDSIRAKRETSEPFTSEEKDFLEADRIYFDDDQPKYKH